MPVALITGVTGQDGAYLAEFLLARGYEVHGVKRRSCIIRTDRIDHLYTDPHGEDPSFRLHYGDMTDSTNFLRVVQEVQPDEIYNFAAQSHGAVSFEQPEYTADSDGIGALRLLEAIRILRLEKKTRFYQASTSDLYGLAAESPQNESTPFYSALSLRSGEAIRVLGDRELPRSLRDVCLQRHSLQPRIAHVWRDVRDAQDHARACTHPHRPG